MTESELLELISIYNGNALLSLTVYVSFTFGYLTVAYFVGSNLSKFQVYAGSAFYSISAIGMTLSTVANVQAWKALWAQLPIDSNVLDSFIWEAPWASSIAIGLTIGTFVSLYFMYDCRRSDSAKDT